MVDNSCTLASIQPITARELGHLRAQLIAFSGKPARTTYTHDNGSPKLLWAQLPRKLKVALSLRNDILKLRTDKPHTICFRLASMRSTTGTTRPPWSSHDCVSPSPNARAI